MSTHARILTVLGIAVLILIPIALFVPQGGDETPPEEPEVPTESTWLTYTDDTVSFEYPESLGTTYLRATDWPPSVSVSDEPWSCEPMQNERGETRALSANGNQYCVTAVSEGAAGSVYTEYRYATKQHDRTVTLAFTVRSTQCGNYDEPDMGLCTAEREAFDADALAVRMLETLTLN